MKRRDLLTSVFAAGLASPVLGHQPNGKNQPERNPWDHHHGFGRHDEKSTNHVVSFGHWLPTPDYPVDPAEAGTANPQPIDRFAPPNPFPRFLNGHELTPKTSHIREGDTVSFIISGFHLLLIYGPGVRPHEIDRTNVINVPSTTTPATPPLINDPNERLYRGLDPRPLLLTNQDRVEVVGFNTKGKYLVICGVLPHFFDESTAKFVMYGYIDVREAD
jgi:hypothetical protein